MSAARPLAEVVADLHNDEWNVELAEAHGLKIVPVSWEDTRRKQMSCVGPNICDMTLACEGARWSAHACLAELHLSMSSHCRAAYCLCLPAFLSLAGHAQSQL